MDVVLYAKFTQHGDLGEKLLGAGMRELIEDSPVCASLRTLTRSGSWWTEYRTGRLVLGDRKGRSGSERNLEKR